MWRIIISCILLGTSWVIGFAQSKHYLVEKNDSFDQLCFTLTATSGTCYIKPTHSAHPINIFGDPKSSNITPQIHTSLERGIQHIEFELQENEPRGISKRISYNVFNNAEKVEENEWHVYLTRTKPLFLNLNYGIGNANVDLSGLAVKQLTINTGSADVNVRFLSDVANKIAMDTFFVKVDMGNLNIRQLNLTRAKEIIADVGFGNLSLDFSDQPLNKSHVTASVGAGSLKITLSGSKTPVLIKINNSPLCKVRLPDNFTEIGSNIYANESYSGDSADLLSFDLDVALGKISFLTE